MNESSASSDSVGVDPPPISEADFSGSSGVRKPWYWSIAPAYAGVFVWLPFFDQLGRETVPFAPWPFLILAGLVAAILCDFLLFRPAALWGYRSDSRLGVVAGATFGVAGSKWITGPLMGVAAVVWHAVALTYALNLIFRGLIDFGLADATVLDPWQIGTLTLKPPVVLLTACWWVFITRIAGKSFAHVIATLMTVYVPTALALLALTAIGSIVLGGSFRGVASEVNPGSFEKGSILAALQLVHLVFGFFAISGLMAVEWGRSVRDERDVRLGGAVGVALSCFLTTSFAILTVACSDGGMSQNGVEDGALSWSDTGVPSFTFIRAVERTIGGPLAGIVLALFGVAALAPACYSVYLYTHRFYEQWPGISRKYWAWVGSLGAFVLVATSSVERADTVFTIMGAVFAPAVGCIAADFCRQRGRWSGIRRGYNPAGMISWLLGVGIGLIPELPRVIDLPIASQFQPASLLAYAAAFLCYTLLASLGWESKPPLIPEEL